MDDEEKKDQQAPQENDDQQSPFDQTGQVTDKAKQVGKRALKGFRGTGAAGAATTETAAGEATEVGAQAAEKSATKIATKALQVALRAGGSNIGGWAVVIVIAVVFAMTILLAILGGQQTTTATNFNPPPEEEPPLEEGRCSVVEIPGLTCLVDAPSHVELGEDYKYKITGNYRSQEGGKAIEDFVLMLRISPVDAIELSDVPGVYVLSGDKSTYTWRVSEPSNFELFTLVSGSNPPEYNFEFELSANAKRDNTTVTAEFLVE